LDKTEEGKELKGEMNINNLRIHLKKLLRSLAKVKAIRDKLNEE